MAMDAHTEAGRTWFLKGIAAFERGEFDAAEQAFVQALSHVPGRPSVLLNLGVTRVHRQRFADAIDPLSAAVAADASMADGWVALGQALAETGRWADALNAIDRARALGIDHPDLALRRARVLARLHRWAEAMQAYQQLLTLAPGQGAAWVELGEIYRQHGQTDRAAEAYRQGQAHGADPEWVQYLLAAVTQTGHVPQPPRAYVQTLFDQYAADFDQHLVGTLRYQGHQAVVDLLPVTPGHAWGDVLDLGCGTGLCGDALRTRATRLVGIDLSADMLDKARARGVYHSLHHGDVHEVLETLDGPFDAVVAADVFIYVGELHRLFAALAPCLRSGGYVTFSVESGLAGSGARLLPSLRYSHAPDYIDQLARRHGFVRHAQHTAPIRFDQARPVMADFVCLVKSVTLGHTVIGE